MMNHSRTSLVIILSFAFIRFTSQKTAPMSYFEHYIFLKFPIHEQQMIVPNVPFLTRSMVFNMSVQTVEYLLRFLTSIFNLLDSLNVQNSALVNVSSYSKRITKTFVNFFSKIMRRSTLLYTYFTKDSNLFFVKLMSRCAKIRLFNLLLQSDFKWLVLVYNLLLLDFAIYIYMYMQYMQYVM